VQEIKGATPALAVPKETHVAAQDKVTLGEQQAQPLTYAAPSRGTAAPSDLARMLEESDRKAQAVIDLIRPLVEQQGLNMAKVASGERQLSTDPDTIEAAKAAVADDGRPVEEGGIPAGDTVSLAAPANAG
jgi:hypothetical protein